MPKPISQRVFFIKFHGVEPLRWKVVMDALVQPNGDITGKHIGDMVKTGESFQCTMLLGGISQKQGRHVETKGTNSFPGYKEAVKGFCAWGQALIDSGVIV